MERLDLMVRKRKLLAVTMKEELYQKVRKAAFDRDIPATAWVREVIEKELSTLDP